MPSKEIRFFFFLLFFCSAFFFSSKVPALAVSILIKNYTQDVVAGNEFTVDAELTDILSNTDYVVKSIGGESYQKVRTYSPATDSWLAYNGAWAEMPKFNIATGSSILISIKSKFYDEVSGSNNYALKIQSPAITSIPVQINVNQPSPTPTQTATPIPTSTSVPPTNTPAPTSTVKSTSTPKPTLTKIPSKTPTPKKTPTPIKIKKLNQTIPTRGSVLGSETSVVKSFDNTSDISKILILIGGIFGFCSVVVFFLSKYEKEIRSFIERKFKR